MISLNPVLEINSNKPEQRETREEQQKRQMK